MPDEDEHLKKAEHNTGFWTYLKKEAPAYKDWTITGLFYTALHYVDAYFARAGTQPTGHGERDTLVSSRLSMVYKTYRHMKDASQDARYNASSFSDPDITKNERRLDEIKRATGYQAPP